MQPSPSPSPYAPPDSVCTVELPFSSQCVCLCVCKLSPMGLLPRQTCVYRCCTRLHCPVPAPTKAGRADPALSAPSRSRARGLHMLFSRYSRHLLPMPVMPEIPSNAHLSFRKASHAHRKTRPTRHKITHRHPAPRSPSSLPRIECPFPVPLPPASSSSRKSAGLTVMCTTFAASSLKGKSTQQHNKHNQPLKPAKQRRMACKGVGGFM